jgi:hypothetical protein
MDAIWTIETALTGLEERIVKRCGKRRGFVFLRELRLRSFDEPLQAKLAGSVASFCCCPLALCS